MEPALPGWLCCVSDLAHLHAGGHGKRVWRWHHCQHRDSPSQSAVADGARHVGDFSFPRSVACTDLEQDLSSD